MKKFCKQVKKFHFAPDFYYENAADFCLHLGYSAQDVADLTGLSPQTIRRYLRNNRPPRWLLPFLLACSGRLLSPGFDGWVFRDGELAAPGWRFRLTARQVEQYTWHLCLLSEYRAKLKKGIFADDFRKKSGKVVQLFQP